MPLPEFGVLPLKASARPIENSQGTGLHIDGFFMLHTIDQLLSLRFDPSQACTLNYSGFTKSHWGKL